MSDPAAIPVDDRGFLLGDGLFETLRVEGGAIRDWEAHGARLADGCATLGLPLPDPVALRAAADAALLGRNGRLALRLTVTAGSGGRGLDRPTEPALRILATAAPAAAPTGPTTLATVDIRRNERSPAARLKTLAYLDNILARRAAQIEGAQEAVMLNSRGEVACAAAGNLFWVAEGRLFTPALDCGVLAGITRGQVLRAARALGVEAVEARVRPRSLAAAEAVMVSNSLIGLRPAASLDGRPLPPHPLAAQLALAIETARS